MRYNDNYNMDPTEIKKMIVAKEEDVVITRSQIINCIYKKIDYKDYAKDLATHKADLKFLK